MISTKLFSCTLENVSCHACGKGGSLCCCRRHRRWVPRENVKTCEEFQDWGICVHFGFHRKYVVEIFGVTDGLEKIEQEECRVFESFTIRYGSFYLSCWRFGPFACSLLHELTTAEYGFFFSSATLQTDGMCACSLLHGLIAEYGFFCSSASR